jgi:hypothetical protein
MDQPPHARGDDSSQPDTDDARALDADQREGATSSDRSSGTRPAEAEAELGGAGPRHERIASLPGFWERGGLRPAPQGNRGVLLQGLTGGPQAGKGDVMPTLPAHPNLDQLRPAPPPGKGPAGRRQSRPRRSAPSDPAVSDRVTLAAAQLAVARSYGFASWAKLSAGVDARTLELAEQAIAFCQASVNRIEVAVRMLAATPELTEYSFATAVVLGDAARVGEALQRDPSPRPAATRAGAGRRYTSPARPAGASSTPAAPRTPGHRPDVARRRRRSDRDHFRRTGGLDAAALRRRQREQRPEQPCWVAGGSFSPRLPRIRA